jgi:hypothetical protein
MKRLDSTAERSFAQHVAFSKGHDIFKAKGCWPSIVKFLTEHFPGDPANTGFTANPQGQLAGGRGGSVNLYHMRCSFHQ